MQFLLDRGYEKVEKTDQHPVMYICKDPPVHILVSGSGRYAMYEIRSLISNGRDQYALLSMYFLMEHELISMIDGIEAVVKQMTIVLKGD